MMRRRSCKAGLRIDGAIARHHNHHELVQKGTELIADQDRSVVGQLGSRRSAASRVYERLSAYVMETEASTPLLASGPEWESLKRAIEEIYSVTYAETISYFKYAISLTLYRLIVIACALSPVE